MSELLSTLERKLNTPLFVGTSLHTFQENVTITNGGNVIYSEPEKEGLGDITIPFYWTLNGAFEYAKALSKDKSVPLLLKPSVTLSPRVPLRWFFVGSVFVPQYREEFIRFREYTDPEHLRWFSTAHNDIVEQNGISFMTPSIPFGTS